MKHAPPHRTDLQALRSQAQALDADIRTHRAQVAELSHRLKQHAHDQRAVLIPASGLLGGALLAYVRPSMMVSALLRGAGLGWSMLRVLR
jgi:hypothetical protein